MYTAWGLPEFCSIRTTSFRVSLEDTQDRGVRNTAFTANTRGLEVPTLALAAFC